MAMHRTLIGSAILLLSGCGGGHIYYPAQVRLCESKPDVSGWFRSEIYEKEIEQLGKVRFHVHRDDVMSPMTNNVFDDGKNYWVRVTAYTEGRTSSFYQSSPSYQAPVPIIFSPTNTELVTNDGTHVHADSGAYYASDIDKELPSSNVVASATDINSDAVQLRQHKFRSQRAYEGIYIRFPIRRPMRGDNWTIHWGTIRLGGDMINIPDDRLCFYPERNVNFRYSSVW